MSYDCKFSKYWTPTLQRPYPMHFVQAPSKSNQLLIYYNGKPQLQGLSTSSGPIMYPSKEVDYKSSNDYKCQIYPKKTSVQYPITHSIPGPYLQSYIVIPNKMYSY